MPNDCQCKVRVGATEDHINFLCDSEFSFEKVYPRPEGVDAYEWNVKHWGTKWDRADYEVLHKGKLGVQVTFTTAWGPPVELFKYLAETYHDLWLRCDWSEEGGLAGVYVVFWNDKEKKLEITDTAWDDWCLEEWAHRFRNE